MAPDVTLLAERDGWLYIKNIFTSYAEPKQITLWWATGVRMSDYTYAFRCPHTPPLLPTEHLGQRMKTLGNGYFSDECGMTYRLKEGGATKADLIETIDLDQPVQRGRKLPIRWYQGEWQKETADGWKTAGTRLKF